MLSLPNNGHFMIENTKYIQINVYKSYLGRLGIAFIYKSLDFIKTFAEYFMKFIAIFSRCLTVITKIFTK